jgi:hypothetical protein
MSQDLKQQGLIAIVFREQGRESSFRDVVLRREAIARICGPLQRYKLLLEWSGEGRCYGETQSYLRVTRPQQALAVVQCEATLLAFPVEVMLLQHPSQIESTVCTSPQYEPRGQKSALPARDERFEN